MKKRVLTFLILFIFIIACFKTVYASDSKNVLQIVEKSAETKYLENDQGFISKEIVAQDLENGEVTIELKVSNTRKDKTNVVKKYDDTQIYIMVSENIVKNDEKLEKYINNVENLCAKIFNYDSKTKIGIIGITGTIYDGQIIDGVMVWGENDEGNVNGSASNAEIIVAPTNNLSEIIQGLQEMNSEEIEYKINLQAGIRLAYNSFTEETNKILISLYDNVPDIAIGVKHITNYGGIFNQYSTAEEAIVAKHENIANYTKNEILSLKNKDIDFLLLRPGDTSYDETWYSTTTGEKILDFDGSPYVQKLYGTIENPTYGKMYLFDDTNIDTIITENMAHDVEAILGKYNLSNVKIVDYFPQDIIEYFEFSYVGTSSNGTTSENIDNESRTITWNIGMLKADEVATLKYKLKLKDMNNENLLEKVIATNEKVILDYTNTDNEEDTLTLASSPKIKLHKIEEKTEEKEPENKQEPKNEIEDSTQAKEELPNTGMTVLNAIVATIILSFSIICYRKYKKVKDIK